VVLETYTGSQLTLNERQQIVTRIFHAMRGLDLLQPMMEDDQVTEIMVNGPYSIFFEANGRLHASGLVFDGAEHLTGMISRYFGQANRLINEKHPIADMRLADGCRVHAVLPPAAPEGPVLSIRKFTGIRPDLAVLTRAGFISQAAADYLQMAVANRQNLFISGGTGTGKTTFLNALSACIPGTERIITIEDAAELNLQGLKNLVRLESRLAGPDGSGEISLSDLIRSALRMRPDRIIVGEVRGHEAFAMLQAMNTGHPGSMSTGHANSTGDMLNRLSMMVLMNAQMPWDAILRLVSSALQLIVHLERKADGSRQVVEISRIVGLKAGEFSLEPVFQQDPAGSLNDFRRL
jgi:pilus assembly protein CpaF